jgi:hypothetical protein
MARLREFHDDREKALAAALAEETGSPDDDIMPRVAAAQLAGVHRLLFDETMHLTLAGHTGDGIAKALTHYARVAFDALEPSLGGYAVRPGRPNQRRTPR